MSGPIEIKLLKTLWWDHLKSRFYVEEVGLYKDPWLRAELESYVQGLDEQSFGDGGLLSLVS